MEEEGQQQRGARHTADGEEHVNVVVATVAVEEKQQQIVVAIPTTEEEEEQQERQGDGDADNEDYGAADWRDAAVAWEEAAAAWMATAVAMAPMNNDNAAEARARSKQAEVEAAVARARSKQAEAAAAMARARSNQVAKEEELEDFMCWCLLLVLIWILNSSYKQALLLWLFFW